MRKRKSTHELFWSKVALPDANGCMVWTASLKSNGYGQFHIEGKNLYAHRVAYLWLVGPIPDGLQLDHLCRNRKCVAPDHLEAVTQQENLRRGDAGINNKVKTHCPRGHAFTPENTRLNKQGSRMCAICKRVSSRASMQRHRDRKRAAVASVQAD